VGLVDFVHDSQGALNCKTVAALGTVPHRRQQRLQAINLHLPDHVHRLLLSHGYAALDQLPSPCRADPHFRGNGFVFVALGSHHQRDKPLAFSFDLWRFTWLVAHANFENFLGLHIRDFAGREAGVGKANILGLTVFLVVAHLGTRSAGTARGKTVADATDTATNGVSDPTKCVSHEKSPFFKV